MAYAPRKPRSDGLCYIYPITPDYVPSQTGRLGNHTCSDRTGGEVSYIFYSGSAHFQLLKCSPGTTCVLRPCANRRPFTSQKQYISGQGRENHQFGRARRGRGASVKGNAAAGTRRGDPMGNCIPRIKLGKTCLIQ